MEKRFIFIFIGFFTITLLKGQVNQSKQGNNFPWIPFTWHGEFINNKRYDKLAIVLPFGASNGIREIKTIQLDTGCDNTFFDDVEYLNSNKLKKDELKNILLAKIDSSSIQSYFCIMDNKLKKQFHCDSLTTRKVNHRSIGTIGSDIFQNKILLIDYPNTRFCILDSIDDEYKKNFILTNMEIKYKLPLIPIIIKQETKWVIFDTGSSNFEIITSKTEWYNIINKSLPVDTCGPFNSWGTPTYLYGSSIINDCEIEGYKFQESKIWYSDYSRGENLLKALGVFGITGNALYLNNVVMLDYKNRYFGIMKN